MFGFVTINQQDISAEEFARYKQAYCGTCRPLHARHGQLSRMCLNHDLAFMALLHMSLYEPIEVTGEAACPMHPIEKQPYSENRYLDYAADMTVALMYHKCLDDVADDGSMLARAGSAALRRGYARVRELYPRQCETLERGLAEIAQLEAEGREHGVANPDAPANCFGVIMGELFAVDEDFWADGLRAFGFELGRFIYMMDAAVDLPRDRESGSYNPFAEADLEPADLAAILANYMARVADAFERLPLEQDAHLLRSAIYAGVWAQFNKTYEQLEPKTPGANGSGEPFAPGVFGSAERFDSHEAVKA